MTIPRHALAGVALLLTACDGNATRGPDHEIAPRLEPAAQWAGGTVHAIASGLDRRGTVIFLAGADTLASARVDDTTFAVALPDTASGALALAAVVRGSPLGFGTVSAVGFSKSASVGSVWSGLTWHDGTTPWVLGRVSDPNDDPGGYHLILTNLLTADTTHFPTLGRGDQFGASATFRGGEAVLTEGDSAVVCALPPVPGRCARVRPPEPAPRAVWVSDSVWLSRSFTTLTSRRYDGPTVTTRAFPFGWVMHVAMAPGLHRAAFVHSPWGGIRFPGTMILDTETGDTAYSLLGYNVVRGAAFTPDEVRLVLAMAPDPQRASPAGTPAGPESLFVVTSATGQRLHAVALPAGFVAGAVATDPMRPLAYVTGQNANRWSQVLVYDLTTYTRVGAPADPQGRGIPYLTSVIVDRSRNTLHLLWPPVYDHQFDLLP